MPNVWYNSYSSQIASNKDHDLVFRLTFFFAFGKIMTMEAFSSIKSI